MKEKPMDDTKREVPFDAELAERVLELKRSLAEAKGGEGRPAREVLTELAAEAGFELKP
jgi:hypothetical protein